ncbi:hypothetical protein K523DRAFT_320192 [Schizophyllum commune Tattone D]|nr:hypothetical protein K523DRAFT_320192 [Schizophyllum commune Tattone D]
MSSFYSSLAISTRPISLSLPSFSFVVASSSLLSYFTLPFLSYSILPYPSLPLPSAPSREPAAVRAGAVYFLFVRLVIVTLFVQ